VVSVCFGASSTDSASFSTPKSSTRCSPPLFHSLPKTEVVRKFTLAQLFHNWYFIHPNAFYYIVKWTPSMDIESTQIAVRLPNELLDRITRYAEHLVAKHPGLQISRTDAVRMLITQALEAHEAQLTPPKKARSKR
jgi:hypothetical protein